MKYIALVLSLIAVIAGAAILMLQPTARTQQVASDKPNDSPSAARWQIIADPVGSRFEHIQFLNQHEGWAVTERNLWKTVDAGSTWATVRTSPETKIAEQFHRYHYLKKVQFTSPANGWLLEGNYLLHTTDDGSSWQKHEFKDVIIRSFRFVDDNHGWFAGDQIVYHSDTETDHPVIYATTDGGKTWKNVYKGEGAPYPIWDIWPASASEIWAVGEAILHSTDGGTTWNKVSIKDRGKAGGIPLRVRFLNSKVGWIKASMGEGYLFTDDGGKTWHSRPVGEEPGGFLDVVYVSPTEAWGVSKHIYKSTDGGLTWVKVREGDYSRIQYVEDQDLILATGKDLAKYKR